MPKERFISYPHCFRDGDPSLLLGWAGWDHLQQSHAIAAWLDEIVRHEGWSAERLVPLLAGLSELIPWLEQWHNQPTAEFGPLGDFFETFLRGQLQEHGLSVREQKEWTPPVRPTRRRRRVRA